MRLFADSSQKRCVLYRLTLILIVVVASWDNVPIFTSFVAILGLEKTGQLMLLLRHVSSVDIFELWISNVHTNRVYVNLAVILANVTIVHFGSVQNLVYGQLDLMHADKLLGCIIHDNSSCVVAEMSYFMTRASINR